MVFPWFSHGFPMFQAGHQLHLPDQLDRATCPRHGLRRRGLAPFFKGHGMEDIGFYIQCEAPKIAFSWFITPITVVYGTYSELVTGAFKPTNITGGPHIVPYKKHLKKNTMNISI